MNPDEEARRIETQEDSADEEMKYYAKIGAYTIIAIVVIVLVVIYG